jgi:hypothetical protein
MTFSNFVMPYAPEMRVNRSLNYFCVTVRYGPKEAHFQRSLYAPLALFILGIRLVRNVTRSTLTVLHSSNKKTV